ncbi:defensin Ec-AMP-D1 [Brachypodium distachyon]|uniref:Knottins-like domain-containing protein n=1 Tax=Brachypodium distachyon TaxID=15368 RepID=A0A0Q3LKK6_BRADI|nr:defensin Ec-AMP-D1 [Brachypodium distachyon]KQK23833.1 hypothetical protein BRADI_1g76420v3 [Brachypodium distachyon]|eukprot:XP_003562142.1 defensin Ec-AMP-D1 [Brachypodium distachyon]
MEVSRKLLPAALLLALLLLAATDGDQMMVAEARTCESRSHRFRGPCMRASNCRNVCKTEGFQDGKCRGFRRRCFCVSQCHH